MGRPVDSGTTTCISAANGNNGEETGQLISGITNGISGIDGAETDCVGSIKF